MAPKQSIEARRAAIGPLAGTIAPAASPRPAKGPPPFTATRVHGPVTGRGPVPLTDSQRTTQQAAAKVPAAQPVATAPAKLSATGFRWPVEGPVTTSYGPLPSGAQSNGIAISARRGLTVRAAEAGEVVYVGRELRGYGNLLLVKHAGEWLTAYAHLDKIAVTRGQRVKRGQSLGTVGIDPRTKTPRLYVETRHDGRPIDPETVLGTGRPPPQPPVMQQASR